MATQEVKTTHGERASPGGVLYDGFISYSHAADDLLAPRLQAGLQRFAKATAVPATTNTRSGQAGSRLSSLSTTISICRDICFPVSSEVVKHQQDRVLITSCGLKDTTYVARRHPHALGVPIARIVPTDSPYQGAILGMQTRPTQVGSGRSQRFLD